MLQSILRDFINNFEKIEKTPATQEFFNKILSLSEVEVKKLFSLDNKSLIDYISSLGCLDAFIEIYENYNDGIKFYHDFENLERKESVDNIAKTNFLAKMGVFSTIIDEKITFVISDKNQVNAINQYCSDKDFEVFLCWSWDIGKKNTSYKLLIEDIGGETKHLIMATGQPQIDQIAQYFNGFKVDEIVEYRKDIQKMCIEYKPDILVVSDNVGGSENLLNILIQTKHLYPDLRIIYFTSQLNARDEVRRQMLSVLIEMGVYDILFDNRFSVDILKHLLRNPKPKEAVSKLVIKDSRKNNNQKRQLIELIVNEEDAGSASIHSQKHIHAFISSKGGVGKTFIVSNLLSILDKEALNTLDGHPPKIAVIDGDFMGCGLSNIFKATNKEKNLLTAIEVANSVIDINNEGRLSSDKTAVANAVEQIRECFIPLTDYKNVYLLGGTEGFVTDEQLKKINSHAMTFIIESIMKEFDIIIADITADFELKIWFPFFSFSRQLFSVVTQDFNSVSNALRHQTVIEEFVGNKSKINYIFNRCIEAEDIRFSTEQIEELTEYHPIAKIPNISQKVFVNNLYQGKLAVEGETETAALVRVPIMTVASQIWPIKNYEKLLKEYEKAKMAANDAEDEVEKNTDAKSVLKEGLKILFPQIEDFESIKNEKKNAPKSEKERKGFSFFRKKDAKTDENTEELQNTQDDTESAEVAQEETAVE